MKRYLQVLSLLGLACVIHAEGDRRDGNWWRELSSFQRSQYMTGFFDGMPLGLRFAYWGPQEKGSGPVDAKVAGPPVDSYNLMAEKYLKAVTNLQAADGLTKFYEDFRNRSIVVSDAVWIVLGQIAGVPQKEIDQRIESYRQNVK